MRKKVIQKQLKITKCSPESLLSKQEVIRERKFCSYTDAGIEPSSAIVLSTSAVTNCKSIPESKA